MRAVDSLTRHGGEEFVLITVGTNSDGAFKVAEKLRVASLETSLWLSSDFQSPFPAVSQR